MRLRDFRELRMQDLITKSTAELKSLVRYGARMLNPKINRLYRQGAEKGKIASDAYDYIEQTGGLFNTASDTPRTTKDGTLTWDKSRNELLSELKREIDFSNMKTSSVQGAKEVQAERERIVGDKYGEAWNNMSQEERNQKTADEWESFKQFKARHPNIPSNVLLDIYISSNGMTEEMERKVEGHQYEEEQRWQQAYKQAEEQSNYRPVWQF